MCTSKIYICDLLKNILVGGTPVHARAHYVLKFFDSAVISSQFSQIYTTPSDIFHFYTIHRYIKARKILKISGQNTYGNYIFYVSGDCHFCLLGFLKIPFSDIEFSFKLPKFEKYPSKLPANTYLYRLLSKDSKNHT